MENNKKDGKGLAGFFQEEIKRIPAEEVRSIIETQRVLKEFLDLEEKPQVYQLQVTSNW